VLTLQAARNAKLHLQSGVTAVRDCGAKNQTTLMLREAMNRGITPGPRLVLAGRPMAIIGGHLSYFGMQATGADECRAGVRQLIQAVANIPKPDAITSFVDRTKRGNHAATAPNQRRHTVTATTNRNRKTI
jgi:imidazolonepropionase-like amidohydrolase